MPKRPTRNLFPAPYVPSSSHMGKEHDFLFRGENVWLHVNRYGAIYATSYKGSSSHGESIPTKPLTGTLAWSTASTTITGTGTAFITELHLGQFILGLSRADSITREMLVVESIESSTSFTASRVPTTTATTADAVLLPVLFALGTKRATCIRGNAIQFPKGHILGVGDGGLRINGQTLSEKQGSGDDMTLTRAPQLAFYNPDATPDYTTRTVGLTIPAVSTADLSANVISITAQPKINITTATVANPCVLTATGSLGWATGDTVLLTIKGLQGTMGAVLNTTHIATALTGTTFSVPVNTTGKAHTVSTGTIESQMRAGNYNIRVSAKNTETLGYSNPTDVIAPVPLANLGHVRIKFNAAMAANQNAWDIYGTEFLDQATTTILPEYNGPWWKVDELTSTELGTTATHTSALVSYSDAEINSSLNLLSFDNFVPIDAEFVDMINGIPIYMSCLGAGHTTRPKGTSPGPTAVPSKPSNPEAVFLNKAITTAGSETIIGSFNTKGRLFALCENSLQTVVLTSLDFEPITFRSLWKVGFRNPYNAMFLKEYLYGFSTQKIVRSVAGGDDSSVEFEFARDVQDYVVDWETGHVLVAYDPQHRAICFFYAAAEKRPNTTEGYYVTLVLPFLLDSQLWNPPMVIKRANADMIVSGVATVGEYLEFVAGGANKIGATTRVSVSSIDTGSDPVTVTCDKAHGMATGEGVIINNSSQADGFWVITSSGDNSLTLDGSTSAANGGGSTGDLTPIQTDTYRFGGGDVEPKAWYMTWNFSDSGDDETPKIIKGLSATGRFSVGLAEIHGVVADGNITIAELEDGHGTASKAWSIGTNATLKRIRRVVRDWGPYSIWTMRLSGSNSTATEDRVDELVVSYDQNASET